MLAAVRMSGMVVLLFWRKFPDEMKNFGNFG